MKASLDTSSPQMILLFISTYSVSTTPARIAHGKTIFSVICNRLVSKTCPTGDGTENLVSARILGVRGLRREKKTSAR